MLIALPAGAGFFALSEPIMNLLYKGTENEAGIAIAAPVLGLYGLMMAILTLSSPLTNILQAIGRADVPAKALALGCVFKIGLNYILIGIPEINVKGAVFGTAFFYLLCIFYIITLGLPLKRLPIHAKMLRIYIFHKPHRIIGIFGKGILMTFHAQRYRIVFGYDGGFTADFQKHVLLRFRHILAAPRSAPKTENVCIENFSGFNVIFKLIYWRFANPKISSVG
jgi:O-antigen/teichoic acid export membrane protein